jgi:hypothetical protein
MAAKRTAIHTYSMQERAKHRDFEIRREGAREPLAQPHRHEYFQIQINLGGDTTQHIGASVRPFRAGMVSFVLPYRIHWVPHPAGAQYFIISFGQRFLRPDLDVDPLDLEDVPLELAPELAPFILQETMDFRLNGDDLKTLVGLAEDMYAENAKRSFFSLELIRAKLLLAIGLVCRRHQEEIVTRAGGQIARHGRREALARVVRYVREHLTERLSLEDAAAAAFLSPNLLGVYKDVPVKNVQELLALAKAKPGELNYSSGGAGSPQHLATEMFMAMSGVKLTHVPYKGAQQAATDLAAGQVQVMFIAHSLALPHLPSGRVKPIAFAGGTRSPAFPDLPTVAESGVPGYDYASWIALFAPKGTPDDVVTRLRDEVPKILARPELAQRLTGAGLEMWSVPHDKLMQAIRDDFARWQQVVKTANISAN